VIERFRSCVGADDVFELGPQEDLSRWFTMQPRIGVRPRDLEQCAAVLKVAAELRAAVVPWGGGQHQELGNVPRPVEVVLSTAALQGLVDYDPADQTVVVRAGTRLADLVAHVREDRLWLPLDPPDLARATVGGVIAANINGPLRTGYGRPRDVVLGMRAAYTDGSVAKSGGRLVKNVTGFDLHRLVCGSLGSLAVIGEVALRLRPLPEREATLAVYLDDAERVDAVCGRLRATDDPVACAILDAASFAAIGAGPAPTESDAFVLLVRYHGMDVVVDRALDRAESAATSCGVTRCERLAGAAEPAAWSAVRDIRTRLDPRGRGVVLRYSLAAYAMEGGGFVGRLGGLLEAIGGVVIPALGEPPRMIGEPTLGEVRINLPTPPDDELLHRLLDLARRGEARVVIEGGPAEWRAGRDVYCGMLEQPAWTARLKAALDPAGVLVPGRFVFGGER
jgi:glycolate oxidase FAD binding subunit